MAMLSYQNDPLAAAVAAAAELARNGGAFLLNVEELSSAAHPCSTTSSLLKNVLTVKTSEGQGSSSSSLQEDDDEHDDVDDEEDDDDSEEGVERRLARSRERNREHARRTRLRKKAQLEALQSKVKGLKAESEVLKQSLEECSLASILVGLSHNAKMSIDTVTKSLINVASSSDSCTKDVDEIVQLVGGKRKRFVTPEMEDKSASNQPLKLKINGKITWIGGVRTHINWKTGVYSDENGSQKQLTQQQLESLRRERNRMHAKMTRDRKKNFIATIEKTIDELESNNARMKEALACVVQTHFKLGDTPSATTSTLCSKTMIYPVTPESSSVVASSENIPPLPSDEAFQPNKKLRHGFMLSSA